MYGKAIALIATISVVSASILQPQLRNVAMPEECQFKNYCFLKSNNYPQKLIDNIISAANHKIIENGDNIEYREGAEKPEDDCQREPRFEQIFEIIDNEGRVRFVAQSEGRFLQKIRTESCLNPGRITHSRYFETSQLNQYDFVCEEHRIEFSFLVLSLDGNSLEDVEIKDGLPVCCSCRLYEKN